MGILDYVYRLKPESGDTQPHNEVGGAQVLSGGTIALVDLGSGVMAWRFTTANSYATIDSKEVNMITGANSGFTMALRYAVTTAPSQDSRLICYSATTDPLTFGTQTRRGSTTGKRYATIRANTTSWINGTASEWTPGTAIVTEVIRVVCNDPTINDALQVWYSGGGAGPSPDISLTASVGSNIGPYLYLHVNAAGGAVIDVRDIVVWHEELSDADCDSVRDDIDTALAASAPTVGTQPTAQSVTEPAAATFTAAVSGTFTGLRWQRQAAGAGAWADVSGATSTTLTTGATSVTGGSWNHTDGVRLQVDWSGGIVTSADVALTVAAGGTAPAFTVQPTNQSVTVGATATFTATATGSGTLTHQWQRQPSTGGGYTNISGATGASYTTPVTTISGGSANNGDTYRRITTGDTAPPATSSPATLEVLQLIATTFSFVIDGGLNLTGLKYAIHEGVTPDLWVAPIKKGADETTDGSGVCTVSVTGLTTKRVGELGCAFATNSDGTATNGAQAATRRAVYHVGVFS